MSPRGLDAGTFFNRRAGDLTRIYTRIAAWTGGTRPVLDDPL